MKPVSVKGELCVPLVKHLHDFVQHCVGAGTKGAAQVSLHLSASLGELAIFVSGRTTEVWWPPEVALHLGHVMSHCIS